MERRALVHYNQGLLQPGQYMYKMGTKIFIHFVGYNQDLLYNVIQVLSLVILPLFRLHFLGFAYAENYLILQIFIFWEMTLT